MNTKVKAIKKEENTTVSIDDRIEALRSEGKDKDKISAYLIIEDYDKKDIAEALKRAGLVGKRGFRAAFHDWLVESARTEKEVADYILGKGEYGETSDNVKKHLTTYQNEWKLAERVRKNFS